VAATKEETGMLTLFSNPELYSVADNNPCGLKIYAFLKLAGLEFRHEHILDASSAPRGQLPYIAGRSTRPSRDEGPQCRLTRIQPGASLAA